VVLGLDDSVRSRTLSWHVQFDLIVSNDSNVLRLCHMNMDGNLRIFGGTLKVMK